jgi:hypothetical protein
MATEAAKLIIEVTAGVLPGQVEAKFTRQWTVTSAEWERATREDEACLAADDQGHAFYRYLLVNGRAAQADEYARLLRNPERFNWVRTDWVWL